MKISCMLFPKLLFIGLTGVASLSVHGQQSGSVKRIYISTKGSDRNQGTMGSPYATAEAALRSVEKQKQGKNTPDIEIIFMAGTYQLDKPIELSAGVSGTRRQPLRIKAEEGAQVTLSGAKSLNLKWKQGDHGIWEAKVPSGVNFQSLYANDKHLVRARYPNYDPTVLPFQGYAADALSPERVATWKNPKGGIVHALHAGRWRGFHYQITGKDGLSTVTLEGGQQNNRPSKMHETYRFVENIFEETRYLSGVVFGCGEGTLILYAC
ncbi:Uncharacterised protein [Sphingobacterium multivorum]|uniref:Uncharacterized protein n=2 Tax=Sphingobacterium multivorum TaxID=28454 RepID=A0A2X2KNK4_SPHMU|nr:Uncharacterised protein [Sphingobacterium multivorum]